jgi:parallel beta-helix repeat protein
MKTIIQISLIVFFLYSTEMKAQIDFLCATTGSTEVSTQTGGLYIPSQGILKVLVVFARFKNDTNANPWWPVDGNPDGWDTWIDPDIETGSTNEINLTHYFNVMSLGTFHVIGQAVSVETPRNKSDYGSNYYTATKEVLQQKVDPLINFSDYDNWRYDSDYHHTNQPDGTVDMIIMIWRASENCRFGNWTGEASFGHGALYTVENGTKTIQSGFLGSLQGDPGSGVTVHYWGHKWPKYVFHAAIHEMTHWLLGAGHPYSAYTHSIWGMLVASSLGLCANAYEREKLAWINPTPITNDILNAPLSDYVTTPGGAYKYEYLPPGSQTYEYYYFENHQKLNIYDDATANPSDKGIFVVHLGGDYLSGDIIRVKTSNGQWYWSNPSTGQCSFYGGLLANFIKISVNRAGTNNRDKFTDSHGSTEWLYIFNGICGDYKNGENVNNSFNPGYNDVFSPYSNPNTNTWYNAQNNFTMEITGTNGGIVNARFYLADPLEGKPSKPQFVQASFNSSGQAVVNWTANTEGDVASGGGYDVYRSIHYDGATLSYTKVSSTLLTSPTFTDNPSIPDGIPVGKDIWWRYNVVAKDNQGKYSVSSEDFWLYIGKTVSGTITANTTWDANRIVVGNITIDNNAILSINPGVYVFLGPNVKIEASHGKIVAIGSLTNPITFTRSNSTQAWDQIKSYGSYNHFSYCNFSGGTYNVNLHGSHYNVFENCNFTYSTYNVYLESSYYNTFSNCTFKYATSSGLAASTAGFSMSNCAFRYNGGNGIFLWKTTNTSIDHTTIYHNGGKGVCLYNYSSVHNFTNNVIEANGSNGITVGSGSLFMGDGDLYPIGNDPWSEEIITPGAGKNKVINNASAADLYEISVDNQGNLWVGYLFHYDQYYLGRGFNTITSGGGHYIYNNAMTSGYEEQQQWVVPANKNYWGGIPNGSNFYGSVDYNYWLSNDYSGGAGATLNVGGPDNTGAPGAVLTSAIAAKLTNKVSASARQQFLVDLKNTMLEVRRRLNDPKTGSTRPRLVGYLNSLCMLDTNDETQERSAIRSLLQEYRQRLGPNDQMNPTDQLCSEAALAAEIQNAVQSGNINCAQNLVKEYSPYVKNDDNKRSLLLAEVGINDNLGEYSKAMATLCKVKQFQPDARQKRGYVTPAYDIIETIITEHAKAAGKVIDKQQIQEQFATMETAVLENYPNPFNPTTVIRYLLPVAGHVSLRIYDILGREVATLVDGQKEMGYYTATFDGSRFSSGVYFIRLAVQPQEGKLSVQVKKILMLK